jgi:serine/threonine-protein kinase RIO1
MESRRPYFENDADFMQKLGKSAVADFQSIWAEREFDNYTKMASVGIQCPQIIFYEKNVLILTLGPPHVTPPRPYKTLAQGVEEIKSSSNGLQASFEHVAKVTIPINTKYNT